MTRGAPEKTPYVPGFGFEKQIEITSLALLIADYPASIAFDGWFAFIKSPAGTQDEIYICKKDALNVYAWVPLGGDITWEYDGVAGALITIFPAGVVTSGVTFEGIIQPSAGANQYPTGNLEPGNNHVINFGGINDLTIDCTAGGALTIQRSGGALTYHVKFTLKVL